MAFHVGDVFARSKRLIALTKEKKLIATPTPRYMMGEHPTWWAGGLGSRWHLCRKSKVPLLTAGAAHQGGCGPVLGQAAWCYPGARHLCSMHRLHCLFVGLPPCQRMARASTTARLQGPGVRPALAGTPAPPVPREARKGRGALGPASQHSWASRTVPSECSSSKGL